MKALIISDDDEVIEKINNTLSDAGYDSIIYKWLLKALDNVEEIQPDTVIISACDYPRHWKTFTQFVKSGIGGKIPQVILFTPADFPANEQEKARTLGIKGVFSSCNEAGLELFRSILTAEGPAHVVVKETIPSENASETVPASVKNCGLVFTHPSTSAFITGKVVSFQGDIVEFIPDIASLAEGIHDGDVISEISFRKNSEFTYCHGEIAKSGTSLLIKLVK
jgi:hypothetical protein